MSAYCLAHRRENGLWWLFFGTGNRDLVACLAVVHAGFLRFRVSGCFPAGFNFCLIYVVVEVYHDFISLCFVFVHRGGG
jgi:hypothetical protein